MYFIIGLDLDEDINELGMLEFIHNLVETMDKYFENVCELDLVFNFNKVYMILDEFFLAGEVLDIDGITGGYNFQNAWTSSWCAGSTAKELATSSSTASSNVSARSLRRTRWALAGVIVSGWTRTNALFDESSPAQRS